MNDPAKMSRKDRTIYYQNIFKNRGYDLGPTGVDGIWGPLTNAAYLRYMKDNQELNEDSEDEDDFYGEDDNNKVLNKVKKGNDNLNPFKLSTKDTTSFNQNKNTNQTYQKNKGEYKLPIQNTLQNIFKNNNQNNQNNQSLRDYLANAFQDSLGYKKIDIENIKQKARQKYPDDNGFSTVSKQDLLDTGIYTMQADGRLKSIFEDDSSLYYDYKKRLKDSYQNNNIQDSTIRAGETYQNNNKQFDTSTIKALQVFLINEGIYDGPVNGIWGPDINASFEVYKDIYGGTKLESITKKNMNK